MVRNLPSNEGDAGSIPGWGTKIPHVVGQLGPHATTTELTRLNERTHVLQTTEPTCPEAHTPQLERENLHSTTREKPARCQTRKRPAHRGNDRSCVLQLRPDAAKKKIQYWELRDTKTYEKYFCI